jgi:hypothetical protein
MAKKSTKTRVMSATGMPGFTAEASLYTADERYRRAYFFASVGDSGKVLPQICFTNEGGTTCCDCYYGWCYCRRLVRAVLQ